MIKYKDSLDDVIFYVTEEIYNFGEKVRILKEDVAYCDKHKSSIVLAVSDGDDYTFHDSSVCMFCLEEFLLSDKWTKIKEEFNKDR